MASRIFEYFVVCGIGPEIQSLDGVKGYHGTGVKYMPALLDQFPPTDHSLYPPPPPQLPTCVLPAGIEFYHSGFDSNDVSTYPRSYPIVLTEGDGSKIYVSCIAFRDPVCEDILEAYHIPANSFADKCICLVSRSPSFRVLRDALEELFNLCFSSSGSSKPLWDIIAYMVSNVPLPTPGKDRVLFAIENCLLSVEDPPKEGLPHADISFQPLMQCLDVDNLIKLFTAVLLERRILLRSNKESRISLFQVTAPDYRRTLNSKVSGYTILTLVSEAICHLICPFRWQHVYIPLLFFSGVDYIDAPTPYMMGLHSGVDTSGLVMDGVVVVDLEYNRVTTSEEIPLIPEPELDFLRIEIARLLYPKVVEIDQLKITSGGIPEQYTRGSSKSWGEEHDTQLRLIFLKFFASLLSGYRNFIENTATHVFNSQAFLKKRARSTNQPPESMTMLTQFLDSQGFFDYLERGITDDSNNLLHKLQDAIGRGQNPTTILPSMVEPEIITISDPDVGIVGPGAKYCYDRFPSNTRTEEQEEQRRTTLALASGNLDYAGKHGPSSPSMAIVMDLKAESLSPRERAAERERMVLDIKVKLQGLWLRLLKLGATEDPLSSFEYGTILALIESDAEGIGGSGFVECIREHIHSGWQCRLTEEQFIAVKELLKTAISRATSRNDLPTIRDALEVSAEMYKKDSNNVPDYVQRHLLALSIWDELRYKNELKAFMYHNTLREYIDKGNVDAQMDYLDVCRIVDDNKFWGRVTRYMKVVTPLVKVLRLVDGDDKNDMGYLYEAMDRAKLELQESLPKEPAKWWKIIDHRWDTTLHHDLHAAGYFLNPRLMYNANAHVDAEVLQGTLRVIGRLSRTQDKRLQAEVEVGLFDFMNKSFWEGYFEYLMERSSNKMANYVTLVTTQLIIVASHMAGLGIPDTDAWNVIETIAEKNNLGFKQLIKLRGLLSHIQQLRIGYWGITVGKAQTTLFYGLPSPRLQDATDESQQTAEASGVGRSWVQSMFSRDATSRTSSLSRVQLPPPVQKKIQSSIRVLKGHTGAITALHCVTRREVWDLIGDREDAGLFISGSTDCTVKIWDPSLRGSELRATLKGHTRPVRAINSDRGKIVSGSDDQSVIVWDKEVFQLLEELKGHDAPVSCVRMLSGERVLTAAHDGTVKMWDVRTDTCVATVGRCSSAILCMEYDDSTGILAVAGRDTAANIWDIRAGKQMHKLQGHTKWIRSIRMVGDTILTGSDDWTARVWSISRGACDAVLACHAGPILCVEHSPADKGIITGSVDGLLRFWENEEGRIRCVKNVTVHSASILSINAGEHWLGIGAADNSMSLFHRPQERLGSFSGTGSKMAGWQLYRTPQKTLAVVRCVSSDLDRKRICSGGRNGLLRLWEATINI